MANRKFIMRFSSGIMAAMLSFSMLTSSVFAADDAINGSFTSSDAIVGDCTLDSGALDPEIVDIPVSTGTKLDSEAKANESYVSSGSTVNSVGSRDWDAYTSDSLYSRLSSSEKKLYEAYNSVLEKYLNNSSVDATVYSTSSYSYYITGSVNYSQYGLTKTQAFTVAQLFLYNNPQYYFASSVFLTTDTNIWFTIYSSFADGTARSAETDSLFNKLDSWILSCSDYETTTYQKERSAHKKICDNISYVEGVYDQSVYSAVEQQKTVCAGYAEVFSMMMNAMNVDTMVVLSDCHAWDVIKLDNNKYYGVDTTWDDSLGDFYLFNVCDTSLKQYDTSKTEHTVSSTWSSSWMPTLDTSNYLPTYYDSTGSHDEGSVALSAPDDLSGTYDSNTDAIRIDWSEVSGAAEYEVDAYAAGTLIGTDKVTVNHIRILNVAGRAITVKIRAVGDNNGTACYSSWSTIVYSNGSFSAYRDDSGTTLSAPEGLMVADYGTNSVGLSWNSVANASGYTVQLYSDSNKKNLLATLTTKSTYVNISGVNAGDQIYAYVRAFKTVSGVIYYSDWSAITITQKSSTDTSVGVPTSLSFNKVSSTSAKVTWVAGTNAKSTNVEIRSGSETGTKLGSLNTSGQTFKLTGMVSGKTYYVRLQSVASDGNTSSWVSMPISVTSDDSGNNSGSLSAPGSFAYSVISSTSGRLSWALQSKAVAYYIQISRSSDFSSVIGSGTLSGTTIRVNNMTSGRKYYARVRAVDANKAVSSWSVISFTPGTSSSSSDGTVTLTAPANVKISVSGTQYRLTWDAVSAASAYTVEIYSDSAHASRLASLSLSGQSVLVSGMRSGKTYYFRVKATKTDGTASAWTDYSYKR